MKKKIVRHTLETLPPMTARREAKLARLASKADAEIDYSDIPALSEEQWKQARRGEFFRPQKRQITARLDADVLEWLRANGKGYQSRMNAILRREMLAASKGG